MARSRPAEGFIRERPSPAVEAVLALVIERPSYSYEVWKRFEQRFADLYPLSKARIYQVIDQLLESRLIEELPTEAPSSRQPRVAYRATAEGARSHREWLAASIQEDPRREELLRRLLATGARDARAMLQVIEVYERAYLADLSRDRGPANGATPAPEDRAAELRELLIAEERRLAREAQFKFISFARQHIHAALEDGRTRP
jgi:DNA-binding PadR family transcriptional regulator